MPPDPADTQPLWILPFGAIALAVVVWSGCWRPARLAAGPDRPSDLSLWDLLVAFGLMVIGGSANALVVQQLIGGAATDTLHITARAGIVLLGQAMALGLPVAYFIWRAKSRPGGVRTLGLRPRRPVRETLLAIVTLLLALPLVLTATTLATWIGQQLGAPVPDHGHPLLTVFSEAESAVGIVLLLASVTIIGPALEEVLYRGLLHSVLLAHLGTRRRIWVIGIASALFTLTHVGVPWQSLSGLFVLALLLGWLYERTGSLWPAILAHAGFNAFNAGIVLWTARG